VALASRRPSDATHKLPASVVESRAPVADVAADTMTMTDLREPGGDIAGDDLHH